MLGARIALCLMQSDERIVASVAGSQRGQDGTAVVSVLRFGGTHAPYTTTAVVSSQEDRMEIYSWTSRLLWLALAPRGILSGSPPHPATVRRQAGLEAPAQ